MNLASSLSDFLNTGGNVLWSILLVTFWLFFLIIERYWFFLREYPALRQQRRDAWNARVDKSSWVAEQQRKQLLSELDCMMSQRMTLIPALIALLPMLGLLGTVTGMIQVFEVMAYLGSGNPRAMANGVSAATIPTMAGMVISLLGIPFATELKRRYLRELRENAEAMPTH
ncbi:MotA/TolQ/ExbB proton channel family protein [Cellvibrio japonicus]|uniref:TonB system transport protein ExbB2 n=1 Tax=Cellvibrio japonicus (strain Ueda107) TaxID=498211 RepID=B3PJG3_CELJU|nr:MotA/TolQ/ExbB proton channel family protein [Cellvibrio japonicus]ACE84763.1 TonB system transport protein ExbB2 [Cellvibrio japonicus Ueda107]QEI11254.1 MotA/TolQ/ExbB proton channel family protein [Cellvibrio japonicus]QEI14828.1 MotA/TolQ/ExbB proton channel family protein [Cellvibrio japonicus]QEI18408.1 MotA/TolQ/ExbB proton channel family protein [Cellvibrio japonicus]